MNPNETSAAILAQFLRARAHSNGSHTYVVSSFLDDNTTPCRWQLEDDAELISLTCTMADLSKAPDLSRLTQVNTQLTAGTFLWDGCKLYFRITHLLTELPLTAAVLSRMESLAVSALQTFRSPLCQPASDDLHITEADLLRLFQSLAAENEGI